MVVNEIPEAHLRQLRNTDKCELYFSLKFQYENLIVQEEIHAVRRSSENIASMSKHINNKINYYLNKQKNAAKSTANKDKTNSSGDDVDKEKDEESDVEKIEINVPILFKVGNQVMKCDRKLSDIISKGKSFGFEINGKSYKGFVNKPYVVSITLPEQLFVGSCVAALHISSMFMMQGKSEWTWFVSSEGNQWEVAGKGQTFCPKEEHLGKLIKLKCIPKNNKSTGSPYEVVSSGKIRETPRVPDDLFEKRHKLTRDRIGKHGIRVVSYNTLADHYVESQYPYCPPEALAVDYRKQAILKELLGYNADIICLQEVDQRIYQSYLSKKLQENGYGTVFHKKGNKVPEGLAIIYKSKFKLRDSHQVVLSDLVKCDSLYNPILKLVKNDKLIKDQFLKQVTSLQYCKLIVAGTDKMIIVANTHLYYHQDAGHIRLLQALVITEYLREVIKEMNNMYSDVALIFCGDFNSQAQSSTFQYLLNGVVNLDHEEVHRLPLMKEMKHNLKLDTACGTPEFTNYVDVFKGCLDYIFYQPSKMTVTNVIEFPSEDELKENVALPSVKFPSDHVALIADFKFNSGSS